MSNTNTTTAAALVRCRQAADLAVADYLRQVATEVLAAEVVPAIDVDLLDACLDAARVEWDAAQLSVDAEISDFLDRYLPKGDV